MSDAGDKKEIIFLVADKSMKSVVEGILSRPEALGIRNFKMDIRSHPHHDPGCYLESHEYLRPFINQYEYSLVMFDHEGCGKEESTRESLEREVEERLSNNGWSRKSSVIVIDPELEIWVWSDSPDVEDVLGWKGSSIKLRDWLSDKNFLSPGESKPIQPKEAMKKALREVRKRYSPAILKQLSQKVSFSRCEDSAFTKFKTTLNEWFPPL